MANGRLTSVARDAVAACCTSRMFAAAQLRRRCCEPLSVVWAKRSRAKPVTRTLSPTFTVLALPVKTKIPSEVAVLPSPVGSWMKKPLLPVEPSKSPTTTPSRASRCPGDRRCGAAALDRVDRRVRIAADRSVVIEDRALSLPVGKCRAGHVGDVDEERFVWLDGGVAVDEDVERVARLPAGIVWAGQRLRGVVAVGCSRAAVRRRDVEGDAAAPAAAERLTVNVNVVVPALPSLCETSLIESVFPGGAPTGVTETLSTARPSSEPGAISGIRPADPERRSVGDAQCE